MRQLADAIRAQANDTGGDDLLYFVYAVLARAKGADVSASDVHDAWCAVAEYAGTATDHLVPFDELSCGVRQRDQPFVAAVRAVALELGLGDEA